MRKVVRVLMIVALLVLAWSVGRHYLAGRRHWQTVLAQVPKPLSGVS